MRMATRAVCMVLGIAWAVGGAASACTVITASADQMALFGNNEDCRDPYTRIWFLPAEQGKYGRVYLGFDKFGLLHPQGGVNDRGLAFDILAAPELSSQGSSQKERCHGNRQPGMGLHEGRSERTGHQELREV